MSQHTQLGDAVVSGQMKVERVNGTVEFYDVAEDGTTTQITQEQYEALTGEKV